MNTSVIVVGGSLVGLSSALFLAHWKVPVILLERHPSSSAHPRALGYTTRTIEILNSIGVASKLPKVEWTGGPPRRVIVESLAGKWQREQAWTKGKPVQNGKPCDKHGTQAPKAPSHNIRDFSNVDGIAIPQDAIEPVLRECATKLGADLKLGYTVTDWTQDDKGVSVQATTNDGNEISIKGKYLIACDGSRSTIREGLGIQQHGVGYIRTLRSILFRCEEIQKYLDHGYAQFQIEGRDDGFEAFMTTYGDGRWMLAYNEEKETAVMDEATQRDLIRKAADTYSSGRIFLAGDAAHSLPPNRGGYGANTGIADAHNLAWKLSAVLKGSSHADLLETYDAERRPIADVRHDQLFARDDFGRLIKDKKWEGRNIEILDDVSIELGQLYRSKGFVGVGDDLPLAKTPMDWAGQPGTRATHVNLRKGEQALSTLDLFGRKWVLLSQDGTWEDILKNCDGINFSEVEFVHIGQSIREDSEGDFNRLFGLSSHGATLVRPDGFIAWRSFDRPADTHEVFLQVFKHVSFRDGAPQ